MTWLGKNVEMSIALAGNFKSILLSATILEKENERKC